MIIEKRVIDYTNLNKLPNLKWRPWIGDHYRGLVVLGDSHYEDGHYWQEGNNDVPSILIRKRLAERVEFAKFFSPVEQCLINNEFVESNQRNALWQGVAFWNVVPRLLSNSKEPPANDDFSQGWTIFFQIADIIRPEVVLVFSKRSMGQLGALLTRMSTWKVEEPHQFVSKPDTLSDHPHQPRVIDLTKEDGNHLRIVFMNHPNSRGNHAFHWDEWSRVVNSSVKPELLLKAKS